jgi:hypothetical protein
LRDFIVYCGSQRRGELKIEAKELDIEKLRRWPGTATLSELNIIIEGKLKFVGDHPSYKVFRFFSRYYPRISRLAKERPSVPIEFEVWSVKESPLAIAFDAPMKVARVAIALLSMILYGEPFEILPIKLNSSDFIRLNNIVKEKLGNLTRLHLKGVKVPPGVARKFELTGSNIEKFLNLDEILKRASSVHSLGFIIRPPVVERALSFRITEWGGGQIYSPPDPLNHEIIFLLNLFEQVLFPHS